MSQKTGPSAEEIRRERDRQVSLRKLYGRHAATLIRHYDKWKDDPRFYFIELRLDMTYVNSAFVARVADPPYHLGTIIRNSLENPGLFSCGCPSGHRAFAYSYSGSPLSGRIDLGMACPACGWNAWVTRSGWRVRSNALRTAQAVDALRLEDEKRSSPGFRSADIRDLLRGLGVPDEELVLPKLEHKIERSEMPDGTVFLFDMDGGSAIISPDLRVTLHDWNGPAGMVGGELARMKERNGKGTDGEA